MKSEPVSVTAAWCVYMLQCADGSLYTGIATDAARRLEEHNSNDQLAAKYTRARRPVVLVYQEQCANRTTAARREHQIKRLARREKLSLIDEQSA